MVKDFVLFWPSSLLRFKDLEDAREKLDENIQILFLKMSYKQKLEDRSSRIYGTSKLLEFIF